jgi:hypothetical protein
MAVVSLKGSRVITNADATPMVISAPGTGGGAVRSWTETVETNADDSASSTYLLARLPSNARIMGTSKVYFDDLGTTSATLDIGVYNTSGKSDITNDADAMNNGIDITTAAGSASLISDIANYGIPLWDHVNGQTTDPVAMLDIKASVQDAALTAAGTITVEIFYTLD